MPGTAVKPSEVIQLTIVPSTHRQRGDGRRDAERGPLQPMRAQIRAPITYQHGFLSALDASNWGIDL